MPSPSDLLVKADFTIHRRPWFVGARYTRYGQEYGPLREEVSLACLALSRKQLWDKSARNKVSGLKHLQWLIQKQLAELAARVALRMASKGCLHREQTLFQPPRSRLLMTGTLLLYLEWYLPPSLLLLEGDIGYEVSGGGSDLAQYLPRLIKG